MGMAIIVVAGLASACIAALIGPSLIDIAGRIFPKQSTLASSGESAASSKKHYPLITAALQAEPSQSGAGKTRHGGKG